MTLKAESQPHVNCVCQRQARLSRSAGFTLIEIMVVVVIIGLMVAILAVNLTRNLDRLANLESRRFTAVVNEIRDEAIIAGENFLLVVDDKALSYRFDAVREGYSDTSDSGLLRTRTIERGLDIDWEVFEELEDEEDNSAKVWISALGEITPFDVRFGGENNDYHVFVNEENQLEQRVEKARLF